MYNDPRFGNTFNRYFWKWSEQTLLIKRGDIYYADLRPVVGSEQGGVRPVLIIPVSYTHLTLPTKA